MACCRDQRCAGCAVADPLAHIPLLEETCPCPSNGKVTQHDPVLSSYFPSDVSHKVYFGPDPSTIRQAMGPASWSPCVTPAVPTVAVGVTAMWLPSSPTAAPTPSALLSLQGQAAPRELPHHAAPGAAGPLVWSPRPARFECWAEDGCAAPGAHGPLHILAVVDGEDPAPTAGVPPVCAFLCPCVSPESPPAPPLLFECSCTGDVLLTPAAPPSSEMRGSFLHSWHSMRSPSFLPTAPSRPVLPPAGNTSAGSVYSSVKPPAELKPAVASLGFAALDTPEVCPAVAIYSLPVFIPCTTQLIPSSVHHQLPSARLSPCFCERELGTQRGAEQGVRCQLVSRDVQLLRANAIGFERH